MSPEQIERAVFEANPVAWFELYGRIEGKEVGGGDAAPEANYLQVQVGEAVALCLRTKRAIRLIIYKPRQQGCSTISIEVLYVLGRCVKMKILVIGGQASQTDNLWKILRYYGKTDTFGAWGNEFSANAERANVSNGTLWERETAGDPEAGRSGNFHAVLATEVARWPTTGAKNAADVLSSVLECVGDGPGTCVIMESTAQGPVGVFPDTWKGAVSIEEAKRGKVGNGYIKIFAPWFKFKRCRATLEEGETPDKLREKLRLAGDTKALRIWAQLKLEPEQIAWYHNKLNAPECAGDPMKRDREYPTFEEDGFKASSPSRFDLAALEVLDAYAASRATDIHYGNLVREKDDDFYQRIRFQPCEKEQATVALLEEPEEGRQYITPADNSQGRSFVDGADPDKHAAGVIRDGYYNHRGKWCAPELVMCLMPGIAWDQDILAETVACMSGYYGRCMIVPEANRGELLITELRKKNCMIFERERKRAEIDSGEHSGLLGWSTTVESKRYLVENLARLIRECQKPGSGILVAFPWVLKECRTFIRHKDGTEGAMKLAGCHDDFVMMTGIGMACIASATTFTRPHLARPRIEGMPDEAPSGRGHW